MAAVEIENPQQEAPAAEGEKIIVKSKRWLPLESDPDLMNNYIHSLGVPEKFSFHEVLGFDEMLLSMVPSPAYAVLMLFPIGEASEQAKADQEKQFAEAPEKNPVSEDVYFLKQIIGNACGTIGLLHGILNAADSLELQKDKFFAKFLQQTKGMGPDERAKALEANEDIEQQHEVIAAAGGSAVDRHEDVNLHFNAFACVDGSLYELDGRKSFPVNHGACEQHELLGKAVQVIQEQFVARDPNEIRWNLVALCKNDDHEE